MPVALRRLEPPDGQIYVMGQASSTGNLATLVSQLGYGMCASGSFSGPGQNLSGLSSWNNWTALDDGLYWSWRPLAGAYSTTLSAGASLRSFAQGYRDAHTLQQLGHMRTARTKGFLRPWWEFNGSWSEGVPGQWAWQTYGSDDAYRAHNSPADRINAHRRLYIIMQGGTRSAVNAALNAVGLTVLQDGGSGDIPQTQWALWWSPHRSPDPGSSDNYPELGWPGAAYVDGVSMDAYSKFSWSSVVSANRGPQWLYDNYCAPGSVDADGTPRELPFYWGELGTRGTDDAAWHTSLFNWCEQNPKVKGVTYFNYSAGDGNSSITDMPNTKEVWQNRVSSAPDVYITDPADFRDYDDVGPTDPPPSSLPAFGYSTPGSGWANIGDGWRYAQRVQLPAGDLGGVIAHLRGQPGGGGQPVRAWIVAEGETGEPTIILGISDAVTVAVSQAAGPVTFTFPTPVEITDAGVYRLALVGGTPGAVAQYNYTDGAGAFVYGNTPGVIDTAEVGDDFGTVANNLTRAMTVLAVPAPEGGAVEASGAAVVAVNGQVTFDTIAGTDLIPLGDVYTVQVIGAGCTGPATRGVLVRKGDGRPVEYDPSGPGYRYL